MTQYQKVIINEHGDFKIREIVDGKFNRFVMNGMVYSSDIDISSLFINPSIVSAFNNSSFLDNIEFNIEPEQIEPEQIEEYLEIEQPEEQLEFAVEDVKIHINNLLRMTDFTQLSDAPLTEEQKSQFIIFRQQLRELANNVKNIEDIEEINNLVWPEPPIPVDDLIGM